MSPTLAMYASLFTQLLRVGPWSSVRIGSSWIKHFNFNDLNCWCNRSEIITEYSMILLWNKFKVQNITSEFNISRFSWLMLLTYIQSMIHLLWAADSAFFSAYLYISSISFSMFSSIYWFQLFQYSICLRMLFLRSICSFKLIVS